MHGPNAPRQPRRRGVTVAGDSRTSRHAPQPRPAHPHQPDQHQPDHRGARCRACAASASGVSSTLSIAFLACPGKAAKISPSMTNTSPSAARKSLMPGRASSALTARAPAWRPAGAIASGRIAVDGAAGLGRAAASVVASTGVFPDGSLKKRKKLGVRPQDVTGVVVLEAVLIGQHGPVEVEELRILACRRRRRSRCAWRRLRRGSARPSTWRRRSAPSPGGRPASGFPGPAAGLARGTRPPRAGARSACAGRPPGCSAPADRRAGCARRPPQCRSFALRDRAVAGCAPSRRRACRAPPR